MPCERFQNQNEVEVGGVEEGEGQHLTLPVDPKLPPQSRKKAELLEGRMRRPRKHHPSRVTRGPACRMRTAQAEVRPEVRINHTNLVLPRVEVATTNQHQLIRGVTHLARTK